MYYVRVCFISSSVDNLTRFKFLTSMQALDGLYKEHDKQDKRLRLENRRKKLSEMLLKETKEYEVD